MIAPEYSPKIHQMLDYLEKFDYVEEMNKVKPKKKEIDLNDFLKIKLEPNSKEPLKGSSYLKNIYKDIVPNDKNNVGILTGHNNIMIVDIDIKNKGFETFKEYLTINGNINTYTIKTTSGGYHYYFNSISSNDEDNKIINEKITNSRNYRGVGIDVRCGNGYGVAPGSSVNGNIYKVINNTEIIDIPSHLLNWLVEGRKETKTKEEKEEIIKNYENRDKYEYEINDKQFEELINNLDSSQCNNFKEWFRVTSICKYHNKLEIWDKWSQKGEKYNKIKNLKIWKYTNTKLDINYICKMLGFKQIKKYKLINYNTINKNNNNIDYVEYNNKFVYDSNYKETQFNYELFKKFDTTILKSCPGSGKTTAVAAHVKKYMDDHPEVKFLSIVDRVTLAQQHAQSFQSLDIQTYKNKKINPLKCKSFVCCINSLEKLIHLSKEEKQDYIIFIDEITSFLNLTHNKTLDNNIKNVYNLLTSLIKNAKKVIVADAIIMDNILEFLKLRTKQKKTNTLYISNNYLKFEGVPAVQVKNDLKMLEMIAKQCKNKEPFLCGSDSAEDVTKWYNYCLSLEEDEGEKKKYLLLTAETKFEITDATKQFAGCYVFYSPSVTYGVDFSIPTRQNVFIYQKGHSISPGATYQQSTRTRNIETLYFYSVDVEHYAKYEDLEDTKKKLNESVKTFNSLINVSSEWDEEKEEYKILDNSFFNLFTYSEYFQDTYKTGMTKHYINLLKLNGFKVSENDEKAEIQIDNAELKTMTSEIKEKLYNEYIELINKKEIQEKITNEKEGDEKIKEMDILEEIITTLNHQKFFTINKAIEFLNIPKNKEIMILYKDEITDKYCLQNHLNIIRSLRSDEYINKKMAISKEKSFNVKSMTLIYSKIKFIRQFEQKYKIAPFEVDYTYEGDVIMDDVQYKYIKNIFRITQKKPTNYNELKKIYISMLRNITNNNLIISTQGTKKEDRNNRYYEINDDVIKYHLELNKYNNPERRHFQEYFKEKYDIEEPKINFIDDEDNFKLDELNYMIDLLDIII
jgi:hypothetical protein